MKPILLEVVAPMLSSIEMNCRGCNCIFGVVGIKSKDRAACEESYPDDWKEAVNYLGNWIGNLSRLYRHRIRIRIIDAQSPLGLWKQLRHRVLRFPAFIVNRKGTYIGWDASELEALIDGYVREGL
ncbi:MAG: hypothetical protein KKE57_00760 [Proteobacteria bacterium]|nr:hypothetical protein [Pseudomonadota bacterium]